MTRIPDLEHALHSAAQRLDEDPEIQSPRVVSRWARTRLPLMVSVGTLTVAGGALAATVALSTGDPVPPAPRDDQIASVLGDIAPGSERVINSVTAKDPDGGPDWGIRIFAIKTPRGVVCTGIGRTQNGQIGVVGRDGVFNNDGRFHPLPADASQSGTCGGTPANGALYLRSDGPTIPASGYTGRPGSSIGGCKEYVKNPQATQSKEIRRRLKDVPVCDRQSQRIVKYGFAGPSAAKVTYANDTVSLTQTVSPDDSGAYIFVLRPRDAGGTPLTITVTGRDGTTCAETSATSCFPTITP